MRDDELNRRGFLERCACLALGGGALGLSGILDRVALAAPPAADYRALVCVFLFGGNDAFNLLAPIDGQDRADYDLSRPFLGVTAGELLPLTPTTAPPRGRYGLHPQLPTLHRLFGEGRLALVPNVGPLVEPVTRATWQARTAQLPPQLFSHNDQTQHWQTSRPDRPAATGWCGRAADALIDQGTVAQDIALNVSLQGTNVQQTGVRGQAYSVGATGVVRLRGVDGGGAANQRRRTAFDALLARRAESPLAREAARIQRRAIDAADRVATALDAQTALQTTFPETGVARQLQMVARLIGASGDLGLRRQVFFVGMGGYDTHGEQATRHPQLLGQLDAALGAFWNALVELNVHDRVTTFTGSDFGRTLTINGDGTDHGWGGHHLVLGGGVRGGDLYGTLPVLALNGPDDTRSGRLIPTTAVDQYAATLARWLGVTDASLPQVFPNLSRFQRADLGFMRP